MEEDTSVFSEKRTLQLTTDYKQSLQNRISDLEKEIEVYKKNLQDSADCLAKKDKELAEANAQNEVLKKEIEKLNVELEVYRNSNENSRVIAPEHVKIEPQVKIEPPEESETIVVKQEPVAPDEVAAAEENLSQVTGKSSHVQVENEPKDDSQREIPTAKILTATADTGQSEVSTAEDLNPTADTTPSENLNPQNDAGQSGLSIAEDLRATAEAALQDTGYVYDENSGLYYDHKYGYYYDPNKQLFYEPKCGTYFYYNGETETYEFHSQVDLSQYATSYSTGATHNSYYQPGYPTQSQQYDYNTYSRYSDGFHRQRHSNDADRHYSDKYRYEHRHRSSSREDRRHSSSREERHRYDRHDKRRSESRKKDDRKSPKTPEKSKKRAEHKKEKKRKLSPSRDKENRKKKKSKKKKEKTKSRDRNDPPQNSENNSGNLSDENSAIKDNVRTSVNEEGEIVDDSDNEDVDESVHGKNKTNTSQDNSKDNSRHGDTRSDVMVRNREAEALIDDDQEDIDGEPYDISIRQRPDDDEEDIDGQPYDVSIRQSSGDDQEGIDGVLYDVSIGQIPTDMDVDHGADNNTTTQRKAKSKTKSKRRAPTHSLKPYPLLPEESNNINSESPAPNCRQTDSKYVAEQEYDREKRRDLMSSASKTDRVIDTDEEDEDINEELYDIFYERGQESMDVDHHVKPETRAESHDILCKQGEHMDVDHSMNIGSTSDKIKPVKFLIKTVSSRQPSPVLKLNVAFEEESEDSSNQSECQESVSEVKYYHKKRSKCDLEKKTSVSLSKQLKLCTNTARQSIDQAESQPQTIVPRSSGLLSNVGKVKQNRQFKPVKKLPKNDLDHGGNKSALINNDPSSDTTTDELKSTDSKITANTKPAGAAAEMKSAEDGHQRQLSMESCSTDSSDSSSDSSVCSGESELESGEICDSSSSSGAGRSQSVTPLVDYIMSEGSENEEEVREYKADFRPIDNDTEVAGQWPPCIRIIVTDSDVIEPGTLFIVTCTGATIGREKAMGHTVLIPDLNISKSHAGISYDTVKNQYEIIDQASQNGTYLNEERLSETKVTSKSYPLNHGDTLQFGCTRLLLHIHHGMETCDDCEPGQVKAQLSLQNQENKEITILSKEEKIRRHKEELKKMKKKYGLKNSAYVDNMAAIKNSGYKDMAEVRRRTVGSDHPFQPEEAPASVHRPLSVENKGHKMLMKMGWSEGQSLGKDNAGIQEPISVKYRSQQTAGLGFAGAGEGSIDNVAGISKRQKWLQAQKRYNDSKDNTS